MMEKEDMIRLIEAFEAWELLNMIVHELTNGYRIGSEKLLKLDGIYEVIRNNSRYYTDEDTDEDNLVLGSGGKGHSESGKKGQFQPD